MRYSPLMFILATAAFAAPPDHWVEVRRDNTGARRGSAIRYAAKSGKFVLWGFFDYDTELLQEQPLMATPEYDVVAFDPSEGRWVNQLPTSFEREWSRHLPLAYIPRTYAAITTGSERTVMRGTTDDAGGVPRPDLNIAFDQVAYRPAGDALYYFTGGLTARYEVARRRWADVRPHHSPPPVAVGSLAYDPLHDEIVLFGGGHIAERDPGGAVRGYTGTWVYSIRDNDWRQLPAGAQPPPRMSTRVVTDAKNGVLVVFGGDGQTHYLADTWLFDLSTRTWRASKAPGGPPPRAGHFTVYDPQTGLVLVGGGYNRTDLTDMWAYDAARDVWLRIDAEVPTGFYVTADIAPEQRLIVLVANTKRPGDRMSCNELFPVRTTYEYRIEKLPRGSQVVEARQAMPKRDSDDLRGMDPDPARAAAQASRLRDLPANRWVALDNPGRVAPTRTWGSATFDMDRGLLLYWGGGHCGYEGSDVDAYTVSGHTWKAEPAPDYPERLWNHAVRPAGVTFAGHPWMDHGRKIYAYDPGIRKMVLVKPIRLTTGYEPAWLRAWPSKQNVAPDAVVSTPSAYVKYATWTWDPAREHWNLAGPAPAGVDTLVTTPLGVMGVTGNWPARLNDAGYQLPWRATDPPLDNAIYLYRQGRWERLNKGQPSPQNLYELTSLVWDSKREQVILHGGGARRDELWIFDIKTRAWKNMHPSVEGGGEPPTANREAVYLPRQDAMFAFGGSGTWAYLPAANAWRRVPVEADPPLPRADQNRAMVYDPKHDAVLLVLGAGGNDGKASLYAARIKLTTSK